MSLESETARIDDRPRKTASERIEEMSLMDDFRCSNPEEMYFDVLAKRVKYLKSEGGRETMGNSIEDIYQEGREDGLIEGKHNVARTMLLDGVNGEFIQKYFELSEDEVEELVMEESAEYKTESDKQ